LGNLQDEAFGDETHAVGFGERDARPQKHGDSKRPLVEGRQERAWQHPRTEAGGHHCEHASPQSVQRGLIKVTTEVLLQRGFKDWRSGSARANSVIDEWNLR